MDISRRQLAGVLIASAAAAQVQAQAPPAPAPQSLTPQSADAELEAARGERRIAAQIIARVPLPMTVEPAFQFKA
jgi:hypothetical protein